MAKKLSVIAICLIGLATALIAETKAPRVGDRAPSFTLRTIEGEMVSISMMCGEKTPAALRKVIVLDLFQTKCKPCVEELPDLARFHEKWKDNPKVKFYMVGVGEDEERVRKFLEEKQVNMPVLCDPFGNVSKAYGASAFPVAIIIDQSGVIRLILKGKQAKIDELLTKHLNTILGAPPKTVAK